MNWVDFVILAIIGVSVLVSLLRGFTREAMSLAGWILASWVAMTFSGKLASLLTSFISVPSARLAVAFAALFLTTLLLAGLVNYLAVQLIKRTGLSGTDRMVGVFFGTARGILIVAVLVLLGGLTPLPQDPWWQESGLMHYFQTIAVWLRSFLPPSVAESIRYG